jgi:predicted nucleic acid-binding Zn ribbon protein
MAGGNEFTMKEAIAQLIKSYRMDDKMLELQLGEIWRELMGKMIASKTTGVYYKNRILAVQVNSAPLRNELMMIRSEILERLNEKLGVKLIDEIQIR